MKSFDINTSDDKIAPPNVINQRKFISLSYDCDPLTTFSDLTKTGIFYDNKNPIYQSKKCTIYIGMKENAFYALKKSRSSKLIKHEWEMYQKIGDFPTIIKAYNCWEDAKSSYFIQLEYALGGSILSLLKSFEPEECWRVLAHISYALHHIHSNGYIHLDVSPSNILQSVGLDDCHIYKLSDFGISQPNGSIPLYGEGAGPYASAEAIRGNNVSSASDIWSFGAVMYEIVTHTPVPRDFEEYDALRNGTFNFSMLPDEFSIVRSMLDADPTLRPTAECILSLPKVKEIIDKLYDETRPVKILDQISIDEYSKSPVKRQSFDDIFGTV